MAAKNRPIQLKLYVNANERDMIMNNMETAGISNLNLYLRKMALNGYIIRLDTSAIKQHTIIITAMKPSNTRFTDYRKPCSPTTDSKTFAIEDFKGVYAIGGADLSITTDLTCATLLTILNHSEISGMSYESP